MPIDLAKAIGGGGGGVPIGGTLEMHPAMPPLVTLDNGEVFLRSGMVSRGDEAIYPEAYAKLTPYIQGWKEVGSISSTNFVQLAIKPGGQNMVAARSAPTYPNGDFLFTLDGGVTWTSAVPPNTSYSNHIVALFFDTDSAQFVAVVKYYYSSGSRFESQVWTSATGASWSSHFVSSDREAVGYAKIGSVHVIYGSYYSGAAAEILTSTNLTSWTPRLSSSTHGSSIVGVYTIGGVHYAYTNVRHVLSSTNLTNWTVISSSPQTYAFNPSTIFRSDGTRAVALNNGDVYSTSDGMTWTLEMSDVRLQGGEIVLVDGVFFLLGSKGKGYTSTTPGVWNPFYLGTLGTLHEVLRVDSKWVIRADSSWHMSDSIEGPWIKNEDSFGGSTKSIVSTGKIKTVALSSGKVFEADTNAVGMVTEIRSNTMTLYMRIK